MSIATLLGVIAAVLVGAVLLAAVIFLFTKLFGLTFLVLRNIFRFIGEEVTDTLRLVGAILASILFAPLVVLSIVIGRWSASKHYSGALMAELRAAGRCVYRIAIGNLARLFGVSQALDGVERRVPEMMAAAPTRDKPSKRVGIFDGYTIVGSLKGGGSGGKLYIAEPDEIKQAVFAKRKLGKIDQVVIKVFSLKDGSSLPQIVRESRALDAARSLGLVLEHQMAPERFFYVMRFVPGESLSVVTQRLHTVSPIEGLDNEHLHSVMGYASDLLTSLDTYHNAELWHKDVKPDNIIVDGTGEDAQAHLVDFGLVTPMRSAMTLTTHGTEYFRDPELVRQALRGVKVHQIDGSKFDIYGAGAVLFSMIENSFPAHGGLSQLTKRCPEALRWIVRRSMAEYDRRYPSAAAMLADLRVVMSAKDPFTVKPIDLPSVSSGDVAAAQQVASQPSPMYGAAFDGPVKVGAGSPVPPSPHAPHHHPGVGAGERVGRPNTQLTSWWSGKYAVGAGVQQSSGKQKKSKQSSVNNRSVDRRSLRDPSDRQPAKQQVRDARQRAKNMRNRAGKRVKNVRRGKDYRNTPGAAVIFAGLLGLCVFIGGAIVVTAMFTQAFHSEHAEVHPPMTPDAPRVSVSISEDGQMIFNDIEGFTQHVIADAVAHSPVDFHFDNDHLDLVDAKVLMVPMLPQPIDPVLLAELQMGVFELESMGVEFIGGLVANDDRSIELIASMQNEIGSTPMDSHKFPKLVQSWLGSQTFDGVLMLTSEPGKPEYRHAYLVMDEFYTKKPLDGEAAHELLHKLNDYGYGID